MTKTKYFFVTFILLGAFHFTLAQSVLKSMKRLSDTGQTTSYTNTPGEDADYNIIPSKLTLRICGFNLILQIKLPKEILLKRPHYKNLMTFQVSALFSYLFCLSECCLM